MSGTLILVLIGIAVCIVLSGFFSSSEMAFSSANRLRLENAAEDGSKPAAVALKIMDRFDDALSAILIGNNLVNIAASSLGSVAVYLFSSGNRLFPSEKYNWVSTLVLTVLIIIFGETVPKITSKRNANKVAERYSYPIRALMLLLMPLIWLVVKLIGLITGRMKGEEDEEDPDEAVEELQSIIETAKDEDVLDEDQSELVQAAIDFGEISAMEAMTARVDMVALDVEDSPEEIRRIIEQSHFTRLPVYQDSVDNIIGVLYLNHYLKALTENRKFDLRTQLMPPLYVYKTMKLPNVLHELRKAKQHLAIVSDEYGGTLGLISMEDVLEEIVGDIWDETDTVEQEAIERSEGTWELDGDMIFDDFLELAELPENAIEIESETVGGWCMETFGAFPKPGDSFETLGLRITVLAMDGRRVDKVLVQRLPEQNEE